MKPRRRCGPCGTRRGRQGAPVEAGVVRHAVLVDGVGLPVESDCAGHEELVEADGMCEGGAY